jgi:hypothetical protein
MAHKNFARGEAPPSHSYEWAGVAKPPEDKPSSKPAASRAGIPVVVAVSETVVIQKKKPWLWVLGGGALGFLFGYKAGSY